MSLSITPLYAVSAAEPSLSSASSGAGGASSGASGNSSTSTPNPTPSSASSSASEPPRPAVPQQIQALYNQGESITEIAVQLYTTVSIVTADLDLASTSAPVGGSVQLTA